MPFGGTITSNRVLLPRQLAFGPGSSVPEAQKCRGQHLGVEKIGIELWLRKKHVGIELCIAFKASQNFLFSISADSLLLSVDDLKEVTCHVHPGQTCVATFSTPFLRHLHWERGCLCFIFVLRMVGCIANQTGWCLAAAIDTRRQGQTHPTWEADASMEKNPSPLDIQSIDEAD